MISYGQNYSMSKFKADLMVDFWLASLLKLVLSICLPVCIQNASIVWLWLSYVQNFIDVLNVYFFYRNSIFESVHGPLN